MPLNLTVLVPCVPPKVDPVIVTDVPVGPDVGDRLVILGVTVQLKPLLDVVPTFTTTSPLVAPAGIGT